MYAFDNVDNYGRLLNMTTNDENNNVKSLNIVNVLIHLQNKYLNHKSLYSKTKLL